MAGLAGRFFSADRKKSFPFFRDFSEEARKKRSVISPVETFV
jgi:hypothetical protein